MGIKYDRTSESTSIVGESGCIAPAYLNAPPRFPLTYLKYEPMLIIIPFISFRSVFILRLAMHILNFLCFMALFHFPIIFLQ